ncbi:hypothetical protein J2T55_000866 [Methylohalomonas lacus]|uniref:Terminase n=1 Tax=Methylohalomonas lacus TaxID=398773 RepID=A0AAE3L3V8_9GAMM|nr:Mpo1-like protein [Methylohalomonas lacus]MCS3902858.1 hypothetical protein [Methylohalomonas lacus]
MNLSELLRWQWSAYPSTHTHRVNLLVHVVTWPFFVSGSLMIVAGIILLQPALTLLGLLGTSGAAMAQLQSHRFEPQAPARFSSPWDLIRRFLAEQFVTFPRFLLSGGFAAAWRRAGHAPGDANH